MDLSAFWIILTGFFAAAACGLLGSYLVLRKMSLLGDAISHAVLPGIAIAFLLSGSRSILPMFLGAATLGILTALFIEMLHKKWRVQEDASIGIVFTSLFAIGVVIISAYAGQVDLDQECVLYGEIAYTPWDVLIVGGQEIGPRPVWLLGIVFILDVLLVVLLYKEFMISSFDAALATSLGFSATIIHYILMGAVSMTTVAAFESVGAILVVAMLIVPGATAYLLTDKLKTMLFISVGVALISAVAGYWLASLWDSSIAGAMTVAAGGQFALAFILSPKYGLVGKGYHRFKLGVQYAADHILLALFRYEEAEPRTFLSFEHLLEQTSTTRLQSRLAFYTNRREHLITHAQDGVSLTPEGRTAAIHLLRSHRLWETFLSEKVGLPGDHTHEPANLMEHFIDEKIQEKIRDEIPDVNRDPHGKEIP